MSWESAAYAPKSANALPLAPYASDPGRSRGRLYAEPESPTRSVFQRDRDRIVHSGAFRRLQYKTQVFVYHEGDYFRTRLTHSLEVAQITRSICRQLGLNEDLAEAVALAHDLGHTPFGHAGEEELSRLLKAHGAGSFDHNVQTFRILTYLEQRYAGFDGLNLTWESLEGVVKHNGPVHEPAPELTGFSRDLELGTHAGPEAQVAALADDIAYNNHDIDDGLRAGLFGLEDLDEVALVGPVFAEVRQSHPDLDASRTIHEAVRRMIDAMVADLLAESRHRLAVLDPDSPDAVRRAAEPVVAFSPSMRQKERALRDFLFERMYRHYKVNRMTAKVRRVVRELFQQYLEEPDCLPQDWRERALACEGAAQARLIGDYLAGMTDRYALEEHRKLFDVTAAT